MGYVVVFSSAEATLVVEVIWDGLLGQPQANGVLGKTVLLTNLTSCTASCPLTPTGTQLVSFFFYKKTVVNLRNKTGEERERQTLCDKLDNNFV